jgi:hypothetical protein
MEIAAETDRRVGVSACRRVAGRDAVAEADRRARRNVSA